MADKLSAKERWIGLLAYVLRLTVGCVFVYSGFVKAIDPWGTIYKLQEYIGALGIEWLMPMVTVGAFMLFVYEFIVGIWLITGSYRRWAPILALLFMALMLPLTLWIYVKNPVQDCGCFGDAIRLSNAATFWKNMALTAMIIPLLWLNKRIRCIIIPTVQVFALCASSLYILYISFIGYAAQPLIDYRPYPQGSPLLAFTPDDADLQARWSNGKQTITIPADSIPEGEDWEFIERIEPKHKAETKGLAIYEGEEDVTEDVILQDAPQVIVFFPNLNEVTTPHYYKLNSLKAFADAHDIDMIAVAAGDSAGVARFIDYSLAEYPVYSAEDTAIKEVVRGNPAMVYLENGRIVWKNSMGAVTVDDFMDGSVKSLKEFTQPGMPLLTRATVAYICIMLVLIMLSHVPMFIRMLSGRGHRRFVKQAPLIALAITSLAFSSCNKDDEPKLPTPQSTRLTMLVYMAADNNLSNNSAIDVQEIMQGAEDCADANLLIYRVSQTDSPALYYVDCSAGGIATLKKLHDYPAGGTLTAEQMRRVINDAIAFAPASEYGLFLWSHATNWLPPLQSADAPRRSFGNDAGREMPVSELTAAIPDNTFSFIWMDCCLMGSAEMACQMQGKCRYYIAPPTEILAAGAPYQDILPVINTDKESLQQAVKLTYDYYADNSRPSLRSCTMTMLDMDALPDVINAAKQALTAQEQISTIALQTYGREQGVSFYDLRQSLLRFNPDCQKELDAALERAVICKYATPSFLNITINQANFSGLSITLLQSLNNQQLINTYHELNWYKTIFD